MSDNLQTQFSQVSLDAEPWPHQDSGLRDRHDDPSGARPRTCPSQPQTVSILPTEQLCTGQETERPSYIGPDTTFPSWEGLTRKEFIEKFSDKLPKELKVPYFDVMLLYSEDDRGVTEDFKHHLENDIFPEKPGKIKAVLYDGPEFEGLSASKLQHLEAGFKRSTFTFVYLTKQFVECDWCALSSETCLIEAIYNKDKKWCVVPVYTVQRNKADFRIPMGLNSLKGINYYNPDEFYRKGVRRLIGDKIVKREENEERREQECYNYLKKKLHEESIEAQRKEAEHTLYMNRMRFENERAREMLRSQSESHAEFIEQESKHVTYISGQPKTAGLMEQPRHFPSHYPRGPREHGEMSFLDSQKAEWIPKPEIELGSHPSMSSIPSAKQKACNQFQNEPSSLASSQLSNDYASAPHMQYPHNSQFPDRREYTAMPPTGKPQEIHYHHHYYNQQEKTPKTYNISAENVIIGENGRIIANGRSINTDVNNSDERPPEVSEVIETPSRLSERRGSGITSSTVFPDNGFSTAATNSGFNPQTNAVEHSEIETNFKQCPSTKDSDTHCKSDADDLTREKSSAKNIVLSKNETNNGQEENDCLVNKNKQNIEFTPNIPVLKTNPQRASLLPRTRTPIKPFDKGTSNVPVVARVKPVANRRVQEPDVSENDNTEVKQTFTSHQTSPKVLNTELNEDETQLKTTITNTDIQHYTSSNQSFGSSQSISEQSNTFAPQSFSSEETEVLKLHDKKGFQSSLETDGSLSLSQNHACMGVLAKDDLDIQAVKGCQEMGYTEEQIHDALLLLRHSAKKSNQQRHHYSINELLDALNGKTPIISSKNKGDGDLVEDNENWVTIKKDEQSGECVDDDSPNAEKDQSLKSVKKSASDTKLNSQKSKLKKDGCRMS